MLQHRPSVVGLQETKVSNFCNQLANETLGSMFDYVALPAVNSAGGVLLAWNREVWVATALAVGRFSVSACLCPVGS